MIRRPEIPQLDFLQAGSLDDPGLFKPASAIFACRTEVLINSIERIGRFEEEAPTELMRRSATPSPPWSDYAIGVRRGLLPSELAQGSGARRSG